MGPDFFANVYEIQQRLEFASVVAVRSAWSQVGEVSIERCPVRTGKLVSTYLLQAENQGTQAVAKISYGDQGTLRHWGGANSAGFGAPKGHPSRSAGPIWGDVGYEILVHEGVYNSAYGSHPPRKFLEGPVLEASSSMEAMLGAAFTPAFEGP